MPKKRDVKKILIVDDEPDILKVVSARLASSGYLVLTASDGNEGLRKAIEEGPDLVILDILMPQMDGWTVLQKLRANEKTALLPVIMLTAKGDMEAIYEAKRLRATDYFIKPFDTVELLRFIRRYLI